MTKGVICLDVNKTVFAGERLLDVCAERHVEMRKSEAPIHLPGGQYL